MEVWSSVGRGHTNPEALTSSERDQFYTRLGGKRHQWVSVGTCQRVEDGDKWELSCLSLVSRILGARMCLLTPSPGLRLESKHI